MNAYRVILILCRVVALNLWWSAAIGLVSPAFLVLATQLGWLSSPGTTIPSPLYYGLAATALSAIIAVFVGQFAPAIATAAVGRGSLEGDAIASRTVLDVHERAVASVGAGLSLLFFGLAGALISTVWGAYSIFFDSSAGAMRSLMVHSAISSLLPSFLRCAVGFVLAFQSGLRRLIQPQNAEKTK